MEDPLHNLPRNFLPRLLSKCFCFFSFFKLEKKRITYLHSYLFPWPHSLLVMSVLSSPEIPIFFVDLYCAEICREEFDEEKEPDGMVLSGWVGPTEKDTRVVSNGESTSTARLAEKSDEVEIAPDRSGTKRKQSEMSEMMDNIHDMKPCSSLDIGDQLHPQEVEDNDDDDDVIVMLDENPGPSKRKKIQ